MDKIINGEKVADFSEVAMVPSNKKYEQATSRLKEIYKSEYDSRTPFERDEHRILHCKAYRRLKNKTQVFFATDNDHICTRIEHVSHVASIAETISKILGLNMELVNAIAIGHDLGHAPFGHQGEYIICEIVLKYGICDRFWHERNSLNFVDNIETLPDYYGHQQNLNLTYAVRDGIVCHCGEVNEKTVKPRNEVVDLENIKYASHLSPFTYEGCVVKLSDTIAYLGRDIEDAMIYHMLEDSQIKDLRNIISNAFPEEEIVSTNIITYRLIRDLCTQSTPEVGLGFSENVFNMLSTIKEYNTTNICGHERLQPFKKYAKLVLETIFEKLDSYFGDGHFILPSLEKDLRLYPYLTTYFKKWLVKYTEINLSAKAARGCENSTVYNFKSQKDYRKAIIHFISAMTDKFAIKMFNEIISFK